MKIRLNKYLAEAGIASRRKVDEYIKQRFIKVNGQEVSELGVKSNPETDKVTFRGKPVKIEKKVYIALNKPKGVICSLSSKQGQTVVDLVDVPERVYPVGRIDKESTGLVILTNDGDYTMKMTHPRHDHEKEYLIEIDIPIKENDIKIMKKGFILRGTKLKPMIVEQQDPIGKKLKMTLTQGVNRQIRRVLGRFGYTVISLKRVRIGKIKLENTKEGEWKYFNI